MLVNLRGVRESGTIFAIPTYVFVGSMMALIGIGIARVLLGAPPQVEGVTVAVVAPETMGVLLLMRAFADGCTAITGVEAVSNGVPAFARPEARNARITLTAMASWSAIMFLGTTWLAEVAGAVPSTQETVLSQLGRAVFGGVGPAYYVLQLSTMGILILAANTAFADFPRLSSLLARDGFMPSRFAFRGERLAFTAGIVALAVLSIVVVAVFGGRVEALIPLYAVGVFTSITLSQAGMVRHWWRDRGAGWRRSIAINGVGAVATGDRGGHLRRRQVRPGRVARPHRHPGPRRGDAPHPSPLRAPPARRRRSRRRRSSARRATRSGSSSRSPTSPATSSMR